MVFSKLDFVKASFDRKNARLKKIDDILSSQKAKTDKRGISYTNCASTSNAKGKNRFAKSLVITNHVVDVAHTTTNKKNASRPTLIPTCYHCEIKGHI